MTLDTRANQLIQGGYGLIEPLLESSPGFRLDFTVRVDSEAHTKNNRAGFSLIITNGAKHGIEIGFWSNLIWSQNVDLALSPSKQDSFDTAAMTDYSLTVIGGHYQLRAGGNELLAGDTVFYDAPGLLGSDFPYRTPHVLFFGDDTTSASAKFSLQSVELTAVPEPRLFSLLCAGLALLMWTLRRGARTPIHHS